MRTLAAYCVGFCYGLGWHWQPAIFIGIAILFLWTFSPLRGGENG